MDHAVTVGAKKAKIFDPRLVAGFQRVNGRNMITFDETCAALPVSFAEVKTTSLAGQGSKFSQRPSLLTLNQRPIALVAKMHSGNDSALLCLLNPFSR